MAGDIISFHVLGQVIVVLNSVKATKDLLERRGEIYSDRPTLTIHGMMEWHWFVPVAKHTELWRPARKLLDRGLRPAAAAAYHPMQQVKARVLLSDLLANPDEWEAHLEDLSGKLILAMGYGYEVKGRNDRKVTVGRKMTQLASETTLPGGVLVNDLPFLRYIPEWLPSLSYKPLARYGYNLGQEVMHEPMAFVRESIANGTARPSLALENLQKIENLSERERKEAASEERIAEALGSMYAAGTHTTVSSIMTFVVAVLVRPDIQIKAQEQLDAITGRERLPTFEDRARLPFIDAVCKEVLRWRPVTPLAIPHASTRDDVYEGFFIPKGAVVVGNAWAILHDPVMYPEPDSFKPERFLNPDGSSHDDLVLASAFGFGKRICPARHFVDDTLFIVVASLLSVFNITRGMDSASDGYPYIGTGITRPYPFRCSIIPRDKVAEDLIAADALTL